MGNKNIEGYYSKMAEKIKSPLETRNKAKDFSQFDIALMKEFSDKTKNLIDLGAGTGLLVNHLIDDFKDITAVEKYPAFSQFINRDKINVINEDLLKIKNLTVDKADFVSIFGVMNFFDIDEATYIYNFVFNHLLSKKGTLILKHQMGQEEDVFVKGFSEELQTNYYSEYRHWVKEKDILKKIGFEVEVVDIYPPEFNRWDNTHFYAFICSK